MRGRRLQLAIAGAVVLGLVGLVLVGTTLRRGRSRVQRTMLAEQAMALVNTAISTAPPGAIAVQRRDRTPRQTDGTNWSEGAFELDASQTAAAALRERIRELAPPLGLTLADDGEWEDGDHLLQQWSLRSGGQMLVRVRVRFTDAQVLTEAAEAAGPWRLEPEPTLTVRQSPLPAAPGDAGAAVDDPREGGRVLLASVPRFDSVPVIRPCPPQVAIIIDDVGYVWSTASAFLEFDRPLTLSVFPNLEYSERIAQAARARGREIMMHLPMESEASRVNPHTLRTDMDDEDLAAEWVMAAATLPGFVGVNNHQGSIMTADADAMERVLRRVHAADLFFIDSRTTKATVARATAARLGVPTNENNLFLDNVKDVEYIKQKCRELAALALAEGAVIGIAHAHPTTLQALQEALPEFDAAGVQLVYVSALVN